MRPTSIRTHSGRTGTACLGIGERIASCCGGGGRFRDRGGSGGATGRWMVLLSTGPRIRGIIVAVPSSISRSSSKEK
jgi:hypothetical protein